MIHLKRNEVPFSGQTKRNFYLFRLGGVLTQFGLISGPGDEKKAIIKHNKTVKKKGEVSLLHYKCTKNPCREFFYIYVNGTKDL